ncbi:unnamed protein product [Pleuronectes platessa]|uniref:Uncharacterized protein n=1 Tax=Pleuronectes platessa TaxID=8262 RepID=A0A9N7YYX0_PLEPL|nr:unnamed protein product [Pleuronectes platessa]
MADESELTEKHHEQDVVGSREVESHGLTDRREASRVIHRENIRHFFGPCSYSSTTSSSFTRREARSGGADFMAASLRLDRKLERVAKRGGDTFHPFTSVGSRGLTLPVSVGLWLPLFSVCLLRPF